MIKATSLLKKLLAFIVILAVLVIGSLVIITRMIDDQGIKNIIIDKVHTLTGQELKVLGKVETFMFPTPHVLISRVRLGELFSADSIDIQLSPALLYTGEVELRGMTVNNPLLHLEVFEDGTTSWDFGKDAHQESSAKDTNIHLKYIIVKGGKIEFVDSQRFKDLKLDGIDIYASTDGMEGILNAQGKFLLNKVPFGFALNAERLIDLITQEKKNTPVKLSITQGESKLSLEGTGNIFDAFKGKATFKTDFLQRWQTLFESLSKQTLVTIDKDEKQKFAAELSSDEVVISRNLYSLNKAKFTAGLSKGELNTEAKPQGEDISLDVSVVFDELNVADLKFFVRYLALSNKEDPAAAALNALSPEAGDQEIFIPEGINTQDFEVIEGLPKNIDAYIEIKAAKTIHQEKAMENLSITAQMVDGEIILSQAVTSLPGKSQAVAFGILKKGYQGLTFEGSLEANGNSLSEALVPVFPGSKIPQKGLGAFKGKTNVYLSATELRFSETDVIFEKSRVAGAFIAYLDKQRPRIDAALRLYSIDFDTLLGSIGWEFMPDISKVSTDEFSDEARVTMDASWLKNIPFDFTSKVDIEYFKLLDKIGKKAVFTFLLGENHLEILDYKGDLDGVQLEGKGLLKNGEMAPVADIKINADKLFLSNYLTLPLDFGAVSEAEAQKKRKALFEKNITLPHLLIINGELDLTVAEVLYKDIVIPNFALKCKLEDGVLTIERLAGKIWEGTIESSINIVGGAVPSIASSFTITTIDVAKLLALLTPIKNITGKASINGNISLTGVNVKSMLESATGTMSVAGRDITVGKFDLPGIIKAVATVRTVADIVNVARLALPGGRTDFYAVDGALIIRDGVAEIPGMVARTQLSDGSIKGKLSFFDEAIDLLVNFTLISLADKDLPTLGMKITGPVREPQIILDTKSLESYVAKKTADKILQRAPQMGPKVTP